MSSATLALDRSHAPARLDIARRRSASVVDSLGRLHLPGQRISTVGVAPYWGDEISCAEGQLDPQRIYRLLRSPAALRGAAEGGSFNGLKLLHRHADVDAATVADLRGLVVGCIGDDVSFDGRHLRASVVVSRPDAVRAVRNGARRFWSSSYEYRLELTPGEFDGVRYDGVMCDLVGLHVAMVSAGRCGLETAITYPPERS